MRELFEVMHLNQAFTQMNDQMAGMMGQVAPCVPASYWQDFIDARAGEQLLSRMVPVYLRHFTAQDVAGLLKFYKSALGRKVITQLPQTMAEGMKIGQQWDRERGLEMVKPGYAGRQRALPGQPGGAYAAVRTVTVKVDPWRAFAGLRLRFSVSAGLQWSVFDQCAGRSL